MYFKRLIRCLGTEAIKKEYNPDYVGYEKISNAKEQIVQLEEQLRNAIKDLLPRDCFLSKSFGKDEIETNERNNDSLSCSLSEFPTITGLDEERMESLGAQIKLVKELAKDKVWKQGK